ncbi:hypothetical protein HORIV_52070 [Vreelandella olivaria]|uniref:Uncharacterized protein n=1 Tax=Vreelandella olivaria TaxID=390919 RepID=A0ABN5X7Q0_9GAMM|nr:hypothetical protein HORIV_52070 [Halomonas olivaria]
MVIVGAETAENRSQLNWALETLREAGHTAEGAIRAGEVEETLRTYKQENDIDMLVMGPTATRGFVTCWSAVLPPRCCVKPNCRC